MEEDKRDKIITIYKLLVSMQLTIDHEINNDITFDELDIIYDKLHAFTFSILTKK